MKRIAILFSLILYSMATVLHAKEWTNIRIGVEAAYPPLSMKTATGALTGFDIDIARALCTQMKAQCQFIESDFDALLAGLNVRKFDAVIASVNITENRKKVVNFSDPYYYTPTRIIAKQNTIDGSNASLKGKKIGVLRGSAQHWYARDVLSKIGSRVTPYNSQNEVFLDLKSGRIDAAVTDAIQGEYNFLKQPIGKGFAFVGAPITDKAYFSQGVGIVLRKTDEDLKQQLNRALHAIRTNGLYKTIQDKYFSFDISHN